MIHSDRSVKLKEVLRKKIRPLVTDDIKGAVQAAIEHGSDDVTIARFIAFALGGAAPWSGVDEEIAGEILREDAA